MAKETVFSPRTSVYRNLVGCIIVHPRLGHGLVTSADRYWTEFSGNQRQIWTVLWSDSGLLEDADSRIMNECEILDDGTPGKEWGSWTEVVGRE